MNFSNFSNKNKLNVFSALIIMVVAMVSICGFPDDSYAADPVTVTSYDQLKTAVENAPNNEEQEIIVARNFYCDAITIPKGKVIVLKDDGSRNRTIQYNKPGSTTPMFTVEGELIIDATSTEGLKIQGNYDQSRQGASVIDVKSGGKLTMNNGTITNGGSKLSPAVGGGINAVHSGSGTDYPEVVVSGGRITANYAHREGAGIRLVNAVFTMTGGHIDHNECNPVMTLESGSGYNESKGGGIYAYYSNPDIKFEIKADLELIKNSDGSLTPDSPIIIDRNCAAYGGGIFIDYSSQGIGTSVIEGAMIGFNNLWDNNDGFTSGTGGGGICIGSKSEAPADSAMVREIILKNSWLQQNRVTGGNNREQADCGGGVAIIGRDAGFTMEDTHIYANVASNAGAGIYVNSNHVELKSGHIYRNQAISVGNANGDTNGAMGGGIYYSIIPVDGVLRDAVIYDNTASFTGGGVWACPTGSFQLFENNMAVFDNHAGTANGGAGDDVVTQNTARLWGQLQQAEPVNLDDRMLGGGAVEWYKDGGIKDSDRADWHAAINFDIDRYNESNPDGPITVKDYFESIALKAVASEDAKTLAKESAKLFIYQNISRGYGGGVGTNASINKNATPDDWTLKVRKIWDGFNDSEIKDVYVQLFAGEHALDIKKVEKITENGETYYEAEFTGLPEPKRTTMTVDSSRKEVVYFTTDQNGDPIPLSVKEWADKDGKVEIVRESNDLAETQGTDELVSVDKVEYGNFDFADSEKSFTTTIRNTKLKEPPKEDESEIYKTVDGESKIKIKSRNTSFRYTITAKLGESVKECVISDSMPSELMFTRIGETVIYVGGRKLSSDEVRSVVTRNGNSFTLTLSEEMIEDIDPREIVIKFYARIRPEVDLKKIGDNGIVNRAALKYDGKTIVTDDEGSATVVVEDQETEIEEPEEDDEDDEDEPDEDIEQVEDEDDEVGVKTGDDEMLFLYVLLLIQASALIMMLNACKAGSKDS